MLPRHDVTIFHTRFHDADALLTLLLLATLPLPCMAMPCAIDIVTRYIAMPLRVMIRACCCRYYAPRQLRHFSAALRLLPPLMPDITLITRYMAAAAYAALRAHVAYFSLLRVLRAIYYAMVPLCRRYRDARFSRLPLRVDAARLMVSLSAAITPPLIQNRESARYAK